VALLTWLAAGGIESEAPLLAALCSMPWPYRPSLVVACGKAAAAAAAAVAGVPEPSSPTSLAYWVGFASSSDGLGAPGAPAGAAGGPAGAGAGGAAGSAARGFSPRTAGVQPGGLLLPGLSWRLPHAAQLMGPAEMRTRRPNGYAQLTAPLLYGEAGECGVALGREGGITVGQRCAACVSQP
jgi:hypothetical protein